MDQKLIRKIEDRKQKGTLRSLSSFEGMIDFVSNDYLGLSRINHTSENLNVGSTGSRLISGNKKRIEEIEMKLADYFSFDAALCFNSGYDANLGIFSSIPQKGDIVLYDEQIHASVRDGIRLSFARSFAFSHNDVSDLERLLIKFEGATIYIAIEGLYSMSGKIAPFEAIHELAQKYSAYLIVDEAHSAGIYGEDGLGLVSDDFSAVLIKLVTFGKAYGAHGACVLAKNSIREYLINFARPFIYSTALPVQAYEDMLSNVTYKEMKELRKDLMDNICYLRRNVDASLFSSHESSPIQIINAANADLTRTSDKALKNNIALKMVYPPTVAEGAECIRICVHAFNTKKEIDRLIAVLKIT